jgi:hypothetical protein
MSVAPDTRLNILVLHQLGNPEVARISLLKQVFFLRNAFPEHNYLYHDLTLPLPDFVKEVEFDGVILDYTALQWRHKEPEVFAEMKEEVFSFLKEKRSFKIAMPQDDYFAHRVLDDWLCELGVDVLYSAIANHQGVLYPEYSRKGNIRLGFTGYIDNDHLLLGADAIPFRNRPIDVGYRVRKAPYNFGRTGQAKYRIAEKFLAAASATPLRCDVSVREEDAFLGKSWLKFIESSKFTLGGNSGSSLLDPQGEIERNVRRYCKQNPGATFEEAEQLFFPGEDGKYIMTALSPRNLEVGLLKSGQILVEGEYGGILKPWSHYIPLREDCSNFEEVYEAMQDASFVEKMITACYETLRETKVLYYEHQAAEILALIAEGSAGRHVSRLSDDAFRSLKVRYDGMMEAKYKLVWRYEKMAHVVAFALKDVPLIFYPLLKANRLLKKGLRFTRSFYLR